MWLISIIMIWHLFEWLNWLKSGLGYQLKLEFGSLQIGSYRSSVVAWNSLLVVLVRCLRLYCVLAPSALTLAALPPMMEKYIVAIKTIITLRISPDLHLIWISNRVSHGIWIVAWNHWQVVLIWTKSAVHVWKLIKASI